jgi:hypothetical protein
MASRLTVHVDVLEWKFDAADAAPDVLGRRIGPR